MAYLTLDTAPDNATCRALFVPNSREAIAIVRGALQELTLPHRWTPQGVLTPEESAAVFVDMFDKFSFNIGACRVIGEIVLFAGEANPFQDLWLVCDGNEKLVSEYPDLYAVIGHLYGPHDDDHFWVPNLSLHVAVGAAPIDGYPVGTYMGSDAFDLNENHIPEHEHSIPSYSTDFAVGGGSLEVVVPTLDTAYTGVWGSDEPSEISNYPPTVCMTYYIVARGG